jgi:nucleoside-diphosphate-sugar epimerase
MNKILVTGNKGYIGAVLTEVLQDQGYEVVGYDTGYYDDCALYEISLPNHQIQKDIRDVATSDLIGIDGIIHLAALSNDPLGELTPSLTEEINLQGTLILAATAKKAGIRRFVYVSSQSMYGVARIDAELDEDESEKNPLTVYARTKWDAERELKKMCSDEFSVVTFRPSTVFGASPALRCDIVFNNLVAAAYTTGHIELKSDGTPWRPVVHVRDVAQACIAGLSAPAKLVAGEAFNIGIPNGNFTVLQLAQAAQQAVPGSNIVIHKQVHSDERTYRVSFRKILTVLSEYYRPQWDLAKGAKELIDMFHAVGFSAEDFLGPKCNRLQRIKQLLNERQLSENLRWTHHT